MSEIWRALKSLFTRKLPATPSRYRQYRVVKCVDGNGKEVWFVQMDWFGTWQFVQEDTYGGRKRMPYYSPESARERMLILERDERARDVTVVAVEA